MSGNNYGVWIMVVKYELNFGISHVVIKCVFGFGYNANMDV